MKSLQAALLLASLAIPFAIPSLTAQSIDWQRIVTTPSQKLTAETLSAPERRAVEAAIVASNTVWDDCEGDNDWPGKIELHRVALGAGHYTLAQAGPGCARTSQGDNGAMWLLRWDAGKPVVLGDMDGSFRATLPQVSNGLHDVAAVWRNDAQNYGLTLYRFDGKKYRLVDGTDVHCNEGGSNCRAVPGVQRSIGRPGH